MNEQLNKEFFFTADAKGKLNEDFFYKLLSDAIVVIYSFLLRISLLSKFCDFFTQNIFFSADYLQKFSSI